MFCMHLPSFNRHGLSCLLFCVLACASCRAPTTPDLPSGPKPEVEDGRDVDDVDDVGALPEGFRTYRVDDQIFIVGTREGAREFEATQRLSRAATRAGAGPLGETVVVEASSIDPGFTERLWKSWSTKNVFYAERVKAGTIYVIGSKASLATYETSGSLPYTRTLIGDGPAGETVVIEVNKDHPGYVERLHAEFVSRHQK